MCSLSLIGIDDDIFLGRSARGFGGTIKEHPEDFIVDEIDTAGQTMIVSTFTTPLPLETSKIIPVSPTVRTATAVVAETAHGRHQPSGEGRQERAGSQNTEEKLATQPVDLSSKLPTCSWAQQLEEQVGPHVMTLLAKIDAAGRSPYRVFPESGSNDDHPSGAGLHARWVTDNKLTAGKLDKYTGAIAVSGDDALKSSDGSKPQEDFQEIPIPTVRLSEGLGDKVARAKLHQAVHETFPFVKTATERGHNGVVTVVCSHVAPVDGLRGLLQEDEMEKLLRVLNRGPEAGGAHDGVVICSGRDRPARTILHRAIAGAYPYLQSKTSGDPQDERGQRIAVCWSKRRAKSKRKRELPTAEAAEATEGTSSAKRERKGDSTDNEQTERRIHIRGNGGQLRSGPTLPLRFALRKEGREHHRVTAALAKMLDVPVSALSFAGVKDKLAISTQACVVKGVSPEKLLGTNGFITGVTIGNLSYCQHALSLGELSGNKFRIIVRDANVDGPLVESALAAVRSSGFINFFGTQRVGSPAALKRGQAVSYQVGADIIRGDWKGAVRKLLRPQDTYPELLKVALSDLLEGKISSKECVARVRGNRRLGVERHVLQGLVRWGDDAFQAAIQCVPYSARTMWVHAYQSYVWNVMASARIREFGLRAVPGDLIVPNAIDTRTRSMGISMSPHPNAAATAETAETASAAAETASGAGRGEKNIKNITMKTVNNKASSGNDFPIDTAGGCVDMVEVREWRKGYPEGERDGVFRGGEASLRDKVKVLTVQDIEAFSEKGITAEELLKRVVLPLPGVSVKYPTNQMGTLYEKRLEEDGTSTLFQWPHTPHSKGAAAAARDTSGNAVAAHGHGISDLSDPEPDPFSGNPKDPKDPKVDVGGFPVVAKVYKQASSASSASRGDRTPLVTAASPISLPRGAYRRLLSVPDDLSWNDVAMHSTLRTSDSCFPTVSPPPSEDDGAAGKSSSQNRASCSDDPAEVEIDGNVPTVGLAGNLSAFSSQSTKSKGNIHVDPGKGGIGSIGGIGERQVGMHPLWKPDPVKHGLGDVSRHICLTFSLPPGSFATMCLREIMKTNHDLAEQAADGCDDRESGVHDAKDFRSFLKEQE